MSSTSRKERKKETKVKNSKDSDDKYSHVPRLSSFVSPVSPRYNIGRVWPGGGRVLYPELFIWFAVSSYSSTLCIGT